MKRYKIPFSGFVYVEADSEEDANEALDCEDIIYEEREFEDPQEVKEFEIYI